MEKTEFKIPSKQSVNALNIPTNKFLSAAFDSDLTADLEEFKDFHVDLQNEALKQIKDAKAKELNDQFREAVKAFGHSTEDDLFTTGDVGDTGLSVYVTQDTNITVKFTEGEEKPKKIKKQKKTKQ